MTNEEFQRLVLEKLAVLDTLETKIGTVGQNLTQLREDASGLKADVSGLKEDVSVLKTDFSGLKADTTILNAKLDKLAEDQPRDILTILHMIKERMATKEDVFKIEGVLKVLSARTIQHEAELEHLRQAQ